MLRRIQPEIQLVLGVDQNQKSALRARAPRHGAVYQPTLSAVGTIKLKRGGVPHKSMSALKAPLSHTCGGPEALCGAGAVSRGVRRRLHEEAVAAQAEHGEGGGHRRRRRPRGGGAEAGLRASGAGLGRGRRARVSLGARGACRARSAREAAEKERSAQSAKHARTNASSASSTAASSSREPRSPSRTAVVRRPARASAATSNVCSHSCEGGERRQGGRARAAGRARRGVGAAPACARRRRRCAPTRRAAAAAARTARTRAG